MFFRERESSVGEDEGHLARSRLSIVEARDSGHPIRGGEWLVLGAAGLVFLVTVISPPHLMDDVDAVQAQIARNMLASGDWVTARLDGIAYLEKPPLPYWLMGVSYRIFGVHDWAARLPMMLAVVLLCWITYRAARWAFGENAATYAGLVLATCAGLFLFTRVLIPDALVTLTITGSIWAWLRLLEPEEDHRLRWAAILGLCLGCGLLLKGLIALVFPVVAGLVYMTITGQLVSGLAWQRLHLWIAVIIGLAIAAPWHILATLRNPPYLAFSLHSGPGEYRGFFWFYFFNEHLLRFLDLRYPRDYNTVPRLLFWLLNLVWLFPWSVYLLATPLLSFKPVDRAGRARLMALSWIGVVMIFFTFSTTQEYYSMPMYPALALLIGSAVAADNRRVRIGSRLLLAITTLLFVVLAGLLLRVWKVPAEGDITQALNPHPELYTLSLGHIADLTLDCFAFLKLPLALAAFAFGAASAALLAWRSDTRKVVFAASAGMILFFQAARIALVRFDPYLGSHALAQAFEQSPPGRLIEADAYYAFSSVFFYTNRDALLWNGRINNLEYGSYAPRAPQVFIDDSKLVSLWIESGRWYLLAGTADLPRLRQLVGSSNLHVVKENAGNYLLSNHPEL